MKKMMKKQTLCFLMFGWLLGSLPAVAQENAMDMSERNRSQRHTFVYDSKEEAVEAVGQPSLEGIWQLCSSFQSESDGKYRIATAPIFKLMSADGTFSNMLMAPNGRRSVITISGTYEKVSDNIYVENISKSAFEGMTGVKNEIQFRFLGKDLMMLNFVLSEKSVPQQEIWLRVSLP
ncbi:DUF4488 domain-containing protein [Bacteroides pyogenes]|uniref:DUF4488 domain-containing protein n=1 Tax=Bacteroides pyogenes TaxID=310300 RepID=UPI001BACACFB|nr:DUF4488 domain-containing protein [Bacteroides pyogenes]MBR8706096.1 hypothetical protein [Bacteroides pyogenes]MCF2709481.1 DUF4488 domain-containing protein [Bacteroides pyogenes]MDY4248986.1 DUF4488 domain-containing protein [Bacteroides pyogenes]MDY5432968.1 DUF4488 domain-containing protein [Bacteroides pyogenes]